MIIVVASGQVETDRLPDVLSLAREHAITCRNRPGCIKAKLQTDLEVPGSIVFVQYWENMESLLAHTAASASDSFVLAMASMSIAPPEVKIFQAHEIGS